MSTNNDSTNLNGDFKQVYAENIQDLVPDVAKLTKMVPFSPKEKMTGAFYNQPVIVSQEQGVTYAAPTAGAFNLNSPIAMALPNAQIQGYQIALRSGIAYEAASRAGQGGMRAFRSVMDIVVDSMMESATKRLEIALLHGQDGIGQTSSSANVNTTTTTVQLTTATWATGIWAGLENATVQFYNGVTLVSSSVDSIFTVSTVDVDARTVTVTGTTTGITALDIAASGNTLDIYFNGAYGNEMAGLKKIMTNTGTLFGISATTYDLWRGNTSNVGGGILTFQGILKAVNKAVQKGLTEKVSVFVNPATWSDLNSSLAALRMFDTSYKTEGKNGFETISYLGQNGEIEIVSHNLVKEGQAFVVPVKQLKRIGSTDISYSVPGTPNDRFFLEMPNAAGYELRLYTDQALFLQYPARSTYVSGIVNS